MLLSSSLNVLFAFCLREAPQNTSSLSLTAVPRPLPGRSLPKTTSAGSSPSLGAFSCGATAVAFLLPSSGHVL